MKKRVIFVCIHNSARSQMAEAFLKEMASNRFEVESAGLEPGNLNPFVVKAMQEVGIDISQNETKSVVDLLKSGRTFHTAIAVCDAEAAEKCPIFPGMEEKLHWSFSDPSSVDGTEEDKMVVARRVRDEIKSRLEEWLR